MDVTDKESIAQMAIGVMAKWGRIDTLVNNAGIVQDAQFKKMTDEQFERVIDVNLKGVYNCTKAVVDIMLEQNSGVILNASSIVGIYGVMAHYVQQQARDIGIRLALGGTPRRVGGVIVGRGMALVGWGMAAGVAVSVAVARLLSASFFGVGAADPLTFAAVTILMLSAAIAACGAPAARAVSTQPASVLRSD